MCGGRGTRLDGDIEKPLRTVGGKAMIDRVLGALAASAVERSYGVTSPAAPQTAAHVDCPTIETPGAGYVADLERALADDRITRPVVTVAADLPLLDGKAVNEVVERGEETLTVAVPVGRKRALGVSVDTQFRHGGIAVAPAGINVVGDGTDAVWCTRDRRYAVNVNRRGDARTAEWFLSGV
jgi:adenosylcobinamide-phosphate guanylyltransferase